MGTSWASVQLDATIPENGEDIVPNFTFSKTFVINYPDGGKLKDALVGKNTVISFTESSDNPTVRSFIRQLNSEFIANNTPVTISDMKIRYQVLIHGNNNQATFDYTITLLPIINGYVIKQGTVNNTPNTYDASWIAINLKDPVVITLKNSNDTEINYPINIIKDKFPNVYSVIQGTDAEKLLDTNMIDSSHLFDTPIDRWNSLFDPAYEYTPTYALQGSKIQVTTFSNIEQREGTPSTIDFTADKKYSLSVLEKANTCTINVQGHANAFFIQDVPAFSTGVAGQAPLGGISNVTVFAIVAIAAGIVALFWWFVKRGFSK